MNTFATLRPKIRKILVNGALLILSSAISLLGFEYIVRVFFPVYNPAGMVKFYHNENGVLLGKKNSTCLQKMKAGDFQVTVRFNRYGLRDTKDLRHSTGDDLFVVGDSFSFGHGVEEAQRYSNRLETMLGRDVYNISIPSDFDGYEKLTAYAQQHGATIQHVLVGVCMENDLNLYRRPPMPQVQAVLVASPYYDRINRQQLFQMKIFLGQTSALYNLMISLFHQHPFLRNMATTLGIMDRYTDGVARTLYSQDVLLQSVQRLQRLQERRHIPNMTLLIIPSRALWIGENQELESTVHQEFVTLLKQEGVDVVDMRPYFEESGDPLSYHFIHDGHWNPQGHHKAAEVLFRHFRTTHR